MNEAEKFEGFGIVEVVGHKKYAGRITEQTIGGSALLRVDVPTVVTARGVVVPEYSKLIGIGSIYMITPTSEQLAFRAAEELARFGGDPIPVYIPESRQLAASTVDDYSGGERDFEVDDDKPF